MANTFNIYSKFPINIYGYRENFFRITVFDCQIIILNIYRLFLDQT